MSIPADRSGLQEEGRASIHDLSSSPLHGGSRTPAEKLPDDLLVKILSRVPASSLCRFKCVSKHWLGLIDHPDHRKSLPQTLAGFLYSSSSKGYFLESPLHFTSVPGSRCHLTTSLAFLPNHRRIDVMDCCNGLLLCRWYGVSAQDDQFRYVVCSPSTEMWVDFPNSGQATDQVDITRLGFDLAESSHFHVFELLKREEHWTVAGVAVYSSESRGWVYKETRHSGLTFTPSEQTVFLNGHLYFCVFDGEVCVARVDTEGEISMNFTVPADGLNLAVPGGGLINDFIQLSQGRLHYANFYRDKYDHTVQLAVYVLNCESKEWKLKHTVETYDLFGGIDGFEWVGIHPECDVIFFKAGRNTFMCYNMDRRQGKVICDLQDGRQPYLPYVPLYAELQSLHM